MDRTEPQTLLSRISEAVEDLERSGDIVDLPDYCGERLAQFPGLSLEGDWALEAER